MTDKQLLEQALEALKTCMYPQQKQLQAITAIRARLEQPEQEPVAWIERWHGSGPDRGWSVWEAGLTHGNRVAHIGESEFAERLTRLIVEKHNAAITSPQPAPVQERTVTVRHDLSAADTEGAIRDKLIELGWTPPAAPVQEPVAYLHDDGYWTAAKTYAGRQLNDRLLFAGSPKIGVYTTPPAAPKKGN